MKSITRARTPARPARSGARRTSKLWRSPGRWIAAHAPRGWKLTDEAWNNRHRGILVVLWLHVVGVFVFGIVRGVGFRHAGVEAVGIAIFALGAASKSLPRRLRTIAATIGLLTSSAVLVHLSGGSIEMHFHFFVMVPLVALYQDWVTFLVAIAYVALHHGLAGTLDPHSVFNHPAALNHPWKWAAIHALFIAGISAVCLTTWRLLEFALASARAEARVKGEFLSVMSHEIRTPLTAVIGYAGLLADMGLSPEQKQYADTIRRSGDRLLTLINDVLDYSKLEAGRLDLDEAPFDMLPLVDDTVVLVSDIAQQRGVRLSSLVDNSVPRTAIGDGGRIAQVLLNLVSNAVKFTENGEVFVHVSARPVGSGEHEVTMAVRDTGIGIDVSTAERLFDSFTQAEASISRQYGGTGLGLAIARQLCELMGGTIRLESTPGEGSTFSASFIVEEATPNRKRHDVPKSLAGLRALVVGQQDANESLLVRYLSEWGVRPRVTNASQALLWARSGMNFGIVFVLHSKDETDPFGFAVELKTLLAKRRTPLVLVAGPSAPGESAEVFDSVLLDPLRQSAVYDLVTSVGAAEQEPHPEIESHAKLAERYPLRILVAEDNHVTQKVILAQLKRLGYRADAVANGVEAVEATGVRPYDLILMDMHMPDMDGPTAARVIRDRAGEYSPAIVALTADATADARAACREAGMEGFVTKPVRESEFVAALIRCAGGIGAAQQAS